MAKLLQSQFWCILFFLLGYFAYSQDVFGKWYTIDDDTGKKKSIVKIYQSDHQVKGKVIRILKSSKRDLRCSKCKGRLKNKKIEGLTILREFREEGSKYVDGKITDPENGKTYDAKLWLDPNNPNRLKVRGYLAFFYRTQTWQRVITKS